MTAVTAGGDRADARRNRAKVLSAAGQAFAAGGLEVPLGEIARRAGVGAGTVYRHFPTKQALLEAVFARHLDGLAASGERRSAGSGPTEAFFGFVMDVVEMSHRGGPVCEVAAAEAGWPRPALTASLLRFRQVLTALLHAAQRAGGVHPDIGPEDVVALTVGCAATLAARRDRAEGLRLVRLTLDGLRTAPVTQRTAFRDNTARGRDSAPRCEECGNGLAPRPTGRPVRFCGAACRQRAHRRRLASPPGGEAVHPAPEVRRPAP
ncbi:TetR/AcrR family transcriptional regulator [Streptomyces sp. NPDC021020]|uniref:TetR/AcrR family transcriptional regulator n=1 Tax=Streptomyces sp. NPDC021020 TaxID=3365109 RepID=UPI0037AB817A